MIIADTDVLIDYLGRSGQAKRVAIELRSQQLATTAVTAFELWAGAKQKRHEIAAVETLLAAHTIVPLDAAAARRRGEVRRTLEAGGIAIGMADSLIAGTCLESNAVLLTRNLQHFERVPGLRLSGRLTS